MNEWGVFGVIVSLVAFVSIFAKASWSMSEASQRLSDSVDNLKDSFNELKKDNKERCDKLENQGIEFKEKISNHETRIVVLEKAKEIG